MRHAFLDAAIAAIPTSIAHAEIDHRTPGRVSGLVSGGDAEDRAHHRQAGSDNRSLDCGRHYFTAFWDLRLAPAAVFVVALPGTEAAAGGGE